MSYLIRNAAGKVCGLCTHKPGEGNKLPDGSIEQVQYVEDDPTAAGYNEAVQREIDAFLVSSGGA